MVKSPKRIGELLVERGLITEGQLYDALREQSAGRRYLGEILVQKGFLKEEDLVKVLSQQLDIASTSLKGKTIDMELAGKFSSSLILDHKCFPLSEDEEKVVIAIVNPLDAVALSKIDAEVSPRRVETVLVAESELNVVLEDYRKYIGQSIQSLLRRPPKPQA